MKYRKATIDDLDQLIRFRKKQLIDEGIEPSIDIDEELKDFFIKKLADKTLVQWVVETHGEIIASGGIVFYDFPPSYTNKTGKKGYITNMYTKEEHRGKGIATRMLTKLINEAKDRGISKIWLGASTLGRPVYNRYGFKETDEWLELNL